MIQDGRGTAAMVETARRAPAKALTVRRRSTRVRAFGLAVAVAVLLVVVVTSLLTGAEHVTLPALASHLRQDDGSEAAYIVRDLRLPRTVLAVSVGAALGLAGALMQALTRNPLADPGLLGIEQGASAAVVVAIAFFGVTSAAGYVWFAVVGAAAASVVVHLLGAAGRGDSPERTVLAGAAITATLVTFVQAVILLQASTFDQFRFWVVGSVAGRDLAAARETGVLIVVGAAVALALGRALNALALGEETGKALGVRLGTVRTGGLLAVMLLCGGATAAAGPMVFIGLTVPHAARMITGPDYRWILPYSAVLGAALLVLADVVGRLIAAPGEIEAGIVMALIGAPVFVALCRRRRLAQL